MKKINYISPDVRVLPVVLEGHMLAGSGDKEPNTSAEIEVGQFGRKDEDGNYYEIE